MSNIFTRKNYDTNQIKSDERLNNHFNRHIMNINSFENQNSCINPHVPGQGKGQVSRPLNSEGFLNFRDQTDIENKLRNQHLELNSQLQTNNDYNNVSKNNIGMCDPFNNSLNEDSRFESPITHHREMSPQKEGLHFTPHLFMNSQIVHAENNNKMTPVGRMGVSTRYESKNNYYVNTNKQYKQLLQKKDGNNIDSFLVEANALLPSRKN
jgi:hypothetical protein